MELCPKKAFLKYRVLPLTFENESVAWEQVLEQSPPMLNEEGVSFPLFSMEWWKDQRLLSKPARIPCRTWKHWKNIADLLFPFPFLFFSWCKVPSGWTFGKDTLKRHFKKEQKRGYAADEHFVTLEETTQETNAASHKCALVVPRSWSSTALLQPQKVCFGDGYFKAGTNHF